MPCFSLRNDALLSLNTLCFTCHHSCSTAAITLVRMLPKYFVYMLFLNNSGSAMLCMPEAVLLHCMCVFVWYVSFCIIPTGTVLINYSFLHSITIINRVHPGRVKIQYIACCPKSQRVFLGSSLTYCTFLSTCF